MSPPAQQNFCPYFSDGRWCPKKKKCPLIHKWALYNAAQKKRALEKLKDSQGNPSSKHSSHQHPATSEGMSCAENSKPGDSRSESLLQSHHQKTHIATGKDGRNPIMDGQAYEPRNAQCNNYQKNILEGANHVQGAINANNIPKALVKGHSFDYAKSSPGLPLHPTANGQMLAGDLPQSDSLRNADFLNSQNQLKSNLSNAHQPSRAWPKPPKHTSEHVSPYSMALQMEQSSKTPNKLITPQMGESSRMSNALTNMQTLEVRAARMRFFSPILEIPSQYGVIRNRPLKQFTIFSRLPFELRLVIWQWVVLAPHNPVVHLHKFYDNRGAIIARELVCKTRHPTILSINRESRTEALKHFTLTLNNTTYINKAYGTVFLRGNEPGDLGHFVTAVPPHELRDIVNLAVRLQEWSWMDIEFRQAIWQFPNIRRLGMIFSPADDGPCLNREAFRIIRRELRKTPENYRHWKAPLVFLVESGLAEDFLMNNTFFKGTTVATVARRFVR